MVIGVIGAGLSGLIAGKKLSDAGHEVTIFDADREYGGRIATHYAGDNKEVIMDYGTGFLRPEGEDFKAFIKELENRGVVGEWCDHFAYHNGEAFYKRHPGKEKEICYAAPSGMKSIVQYLSRWLDFRLGVPVSSLTYIGPDNSVKRNWMITLTDITVFELDAVIIAAPAVQAYGLIQTSQDELPFRKIIRTLSQVHYEPVFSLMTKYGKRENPDWYGMICKDKRLQWISNESSKRENAGEVALVIQSTGEFAIEHIDDDPELIARLMLENAGNMAGAWAEKPVWHKLHLWKYHKPENPLEGFFMELQDHPAHAALVGDYFGDGSLESAYLSGLKLGMHWANKFTLETV